MASAVASTSAAGAAADAQPNTCLYVKNLNTKTKKPELRRQLYSLFSTYGKVIDVVATRATGMRGQAFIVFRELASATSARRALQGFEFYERSLQISCAHNKSKATIVLERGPEAVFDLDLTANSRANKVTFSSAQAEQVGREKKRAREEARQRGEKVAEDDDDDDDSDDDEDGVKAERDSDDDDGEQQERAGKVRKLDTSAANGAVNGVKVDSTNGASGPGAQDNAHVEEEEDEDEMDMAESDDSDDDDTPGPPAPAS